MHNLALQQEDSWAHMQTLYRECLSVHPNRQSAKRSDPSMDDRFCYARLQQLGELCGGHGPAEEVALAFRTVVGPKECELFLCFDAFGNHALLEVLAHINYGAHDWSVIGITTDSVDKGLVDFQDINGKLLEIAEAGIAGAEVIHRKVNPHFLELLKHGGRGFGILHKDALGELEVEIARVQAGFFKGVDNPREKSGRAEFGGRNIDGNALERQARILPFARLSACFA